MKTIDGFRFAGVAAGIKKKAGARDVAMAVCDAPATAAAVFTTNQVCAAPVRVSRDHVKGGRARGVIVNAGNANACTGVKGLNDARAMASLAARGVGAKTREMLVASTGVIGAALPMDRVTAGIDAATAALSPDGFDDFAEAILTTDRTPKRATATVAGTSILACAKGAGMIAPSMATTLAFVFTDAMITPVQLRQFLKRAADASFNRAIVDGDQSTNDSIFVLASGRSGSPLKGNALNEFGAALEEVLYSLAVALVADGEGAEHVVTIRVEGARSSADALKVARTIATSPLVKTAFFGKDPNWGRILGAAGRAGVKLDPDKLTLDLEDVPLVRKGGGVMTAEREQAAHEIMKRPSYGLTVGLGLGKASDQVVTCDLGHAYVSCNADYRS